MALPRRPGLTRERVLRAALDIVDSEGIDALTMRRLGRELGVEAMSLYSHVTGKSEVVEGVVEQVFRQMEPVRPTGGSWQHDVRSHTRRYREVLLSHPHVVRLVAGRSLMTEGTASFVESALDLLRSTGLDLAEADRVLGVLASFTLGHVAEQVGGIGRDGDASAAAFDDARFPNVAMLGEMKPADYDDQFELGLDFIIAGLERMVAAHHTR